MIAPVKRADIAQEYKWNLGDLCQNIKIFEEGVKEVKELSAKLALMKGTLGSGTEKLLDCLNLRAQVNEKLARLFVYSKMLLDEDANVTESRELAETASALNRDVAQAEAFVSPEILTLSQEYIDKAFLAPKMKLYKHMFDDLMRAKAHTLSPEQEELLAAFTEIIEGPSDIFNMLDATDIDFGTVKTEDGKEIKLTHARYSPLMEQKDREARKVAWNAYYDGYLNIKNTIAASHRASIKADVVLARARKHNTAREAALFEDNIPVSVYDNLISVVREFLPVLHRYTALRAKALGLSKLETFDLLVPITEKPEQEYEYKKAVELVLNGIAPLGEDYQKTAKDGLCGGGWVDVYENEGKKSGAYQWGAFGCHPYILLNYDKSLDGVYTLAHELGHAMHSHYSWNTQPYIYSDYSIFLAEVASTVNEGLLMDYQLKNADPKMRKYLLNMWLEQYRGTLFRQTLFAEFEARTHQMAEQDIPLTLDAKNALYRELISDYYGPILAQNPKADFEWARIPHFFSAFYVFQYSTGYSAAMAFCDQILKGGAAKYLEFLAAGSSDYPINVLKRAGVDMSKKAPVTAALKLFEKLLGELEELV